MSAKAPQYPPKGAKKPPPPPSPPPIRVINENINIRKPQFGSTAMNKIEKEIKKLMTEYHAKISDCDILLDSYRYEKNEYRSRHFPSPDDIIKIQSLIRDIEKEEHIITTKRQCYIQAFHDIESLLDVL